MKRQLNRFDRSVSPCHSLLWWTVIAENAMMEVVGCGGPIISFDVSSRYKLRGPTVVCQISASEYGVTIMESITTNG